MLTLTLREGGTLLLKSEPDEVYSESMTHPDGTTATYRVVRQGTRFWKVTETVAAIQTAINNDKYPYLALTIAVGGATVKVFKDKIASLLDVAGVTTVTLVGGGTHSVAQSTATILSSLGVS